MVVIKFLIFYMSLGVICHWCLAPVWPIHRHWQYANESGIVWVNPSKRGGMDVVFRGLAGLLQGISQVGSTLGLKLGVKTEVNLEVKL